jgi:hypothetical protein
VVVFYRKILSAFACAVKAAVKKRNQEKKALFNEKEQRGVGIQKKKKRTNRFA